MREIYTIKLIFYRIPLSSLFRHSAKLYLRDSVKLLSYFNLSQDHTVLSLYLKLLQYTFSFIYLY